MCGVAFMPARLADTARSATCALACGLAAAGSLRSASVDRMLISFSVTPLGVGEGVGEIVAEAVRVVRASGLPNHTDAMFTTVEGDWVGF